MEILLITDAVLMGAALFQAVVGILFFRPGTVVTFFFFQSLALFASAVVVLGTTFDKRLACAWGFVGLFAVITIMGLRAWRKGSGSSGKVEMKA